MNEVAPALGIVVETRPDRVTPTSGYNSNKNWNHWK